MAIQGNIAYPLLSSGFKKFTEIYGNDQDPYFYIQQIKPGQFAYNFQADMLQIYCVGREITYISALKGVKPGC